MSIEDLGMNYYDMERMIWRGRGLSESVGLRDITREEETTTDLFDQLAVPVICGHSPEWPLTFTSAMLDDDLENIT